MATLMMAGLTTLAAPAALVVTVAGVWVLVRWLERQPRHEEKETN